MYVLKVIAIKLKYTRPFHFYGCYILLDSGAIVVRGPLRSNNRVIMTLSIVVRQLTLDHLQDYGYHIIILLYFSY